MGIVTVCNPLSPFCPYWTTLTARQSLFWTNAMEASSSPPPKKVPRRLNVTCTEVAPATVLEAMGLSLPADPLLPDIVQVVPRISVADPDAGVDVDVGIGVGY